jgi:hypothetical protein
MSNSEVVQLFYIYVYPMVCTNLKWPITILGYLHVYVDLRVIATDNICKRYMFVMPEFTLSDFVAVFT